MVKFASRFHSMRRIFFRTFIFCLVFHLYAPLCKAEQPTISQLLQLSQAGASIELDLRDKKKYSAPELVRLASSMKYEATLTLILGDSSHLSVNQCVQISKAAPGHVIFRF